MAGVRVLLISSSPGWVRHARLALGPGVAVETQDRPPVRGRTGADLIIVHVSGFQGPARESVFTALGDAPCPIGVAADVPDLQELLDLSRYPIRAYFNSYMADVHYRQMLRMLRDGQTWFSPPLMAGALALARRSLAEQEGSCEAALAALTNREREIAMDVAAGMSNREIAEERRIAERTVKAHLTRIFKKLGTRNRHALAVKLRES